MSRMIELLRQKALPAAMMRSASKGALSVPAAEMLEILVELVPHPLFGEEARFTLARWDVASAAAVLSQPQAPRTVVAYFLAPENHRPALLPALIENPQVSEEELMELASSRSTEVLQAMLGSERVRGSRALLHAMAYNHNLEDAEEEQVRHCLQQLPEEEVLHVERLFAEYASPESESEVEHHREEAAEAPAAEVTPESLERISVIQKLARLNVGERVQVAFRGGKDERLVLIRDPSKVVSSAVLESPRLTDQEVEIFAGMKNLQETLLRAIAGKRKFIKNYNVVRALANNPKCPLDLSLALIKGLTIGDLKTLSKNKNVPETVQKSAYRIHLERTTQRRT